MKTIGNILWFVFAGVWSALLWSIGGLLACVTIIGIPFGRQCFKFARFSMWPFGREVIDDPTASSFGIIGNILWFIPGVVLALQYIASGVAMCVTIIGIPFGIQAFKMVPLAVFPFGKRIVRTDELEARYVAPPVAAPYR